MRAATFMGQTPVELDPPVRGDPITGERYYSQAWMRAEWERVWTRVWHIGGMAADLEEPGDYVVHRLMKESVVMIRQHDGSVKAFFNACKHRGNRLALGDFGVGNGLTCSYHGWHWGIDGTLEAVQDVSDFPQGNPCGKLRLNEIPCETWGGFIWFNMDAQARPLRDWLGFVVDQLAPYNMDMMTRVVALTAEVDCNWKIIRDNFNEAYHIPTLHPEIATHIDDDHADTVFEMYPNGHNRMVMKGGCPTGRLLSDVVQAPLDDILRFWELDPAEFAGRPSAARLALQKQRRALASLKGYRHYADLSDSQLTDYYHYTLFPNVTFTMAPDGFQVLRSEPHPTDPEKCIFDHWYMAHPIVGRDSVDGPTGTVPFEKAERIVCRHGDRTLGAVADQDLSVAVSQQLGLHSRGFEGGYLADQEKRVQRFHEILNDHIEGRA